MRPQTSSKSQAIATKSVLSFEEQVALTYRQSACWLASFATRETKLLVDARRDEKGESDLSFLPSLQVAQHLLMHLPGFIPGSVDAQWTALAKKESLCFDKIMDTTKDVDKINPTYLPCCKQCGGVLQAGYNGTTVRVMAALRLSRTQRRRAKGKQKTNMTKTRKNDPQYARVYEHGRLADSSLRLKEQCLQLTCGGCQTLSFVSTGLDKKSDRSISSKQPETVDKRPIPKTPASQKIPVRKKEPGVTQQASGGDLDFIRLPSTKRMTPPVQLLTLDQPRKRKKKKKEQNPLMDFLSSLNN